MPQPGKYHLSPAWALDQLPGDQGEPFRVLLEHGSLEIEVYAVQGHDPQTPHDRDEVYVIMCGSGYFRNGEERHAFSPGDLLFVPAGVVHRFEEFTADFSTWVMFYGPVGGEVPGESVSEPND